MNDSVVPPPATGVTALITTSSRCRLSYSVGVITMVAPTGHVTVSAMVMEVSPADAGADSLDHVTVGTGPTTDTLPNTAMTLLPRK